MLCFSILRDAPSMTCARSDMLVAVSGAVELAGSGGGAWCSYSCGGDAGGTRVRAPWADPLPLSGSGLMPPWVGGAPGSTPRGPTLYHQVAAA